jgi:hypothetical protein
LIVVSIKKKWQAPIEQHLYERKKKTGTVLRTLISDMPIICMKGLEDEYNSCLYVFVCSRDFLYVRVCKETYSFALLYFIAFVF